MTAKDVIRKSLEMAHWVTNQYLEDLSDADLVQRPVPGANHIAWQLGHLLMSEREMVSSLGCTMPELPAGFEAAHSKEASGSDSRSGFGSKAQYLDHFKRMHAATLAALSATPDAQLDQPAPEPMRSYAPTVGDVFNMVGLHEMMHTGQFAVLRRKLGKPVKI